MAQKKQTSRPVIYNRRAKHDYQIIETFDAGLELKGPEVKSIRTGTASLAESFGKIDKGEVFLYNMYIAPYPNSRDVLDSRRKRKLLLHNREIAKIVAALSQKGLALVPLRVYFRRNWAKVEIALGKGKREFDKRQDIKRRESEREIHRYK